MFWFAVKVADVLCETIGKILPADNTGKVKHRLGQSIGGDLCNAAKNNHVHYCCQSRLNEIPGRTQDSLFVLGYNITLNKH